jgi:hypothetical protein
MRQAGEDLRRHPRSATGFIGIEDASRPGVLNRVSNISCSGVLCETAESVPLMTKMRIVLELPRPLERRVEAEGIVVRCERDLNGGSHFNVAILYRRLSDEGYQAIREFVESDLSQKAGRA